MLLIVTVAVPPPGSCQTATASRIRIAKLRSSLLRSGPTPRTIAASGAERHGLESRRLDRVRSHRSGLGHRHPVDRLRSEPVPDPEVRVNVAPARRRPLQLLPQLAHEDVDRPVAVHHRVAPHSLVDLLALHDLPPRVGEQLDQLELAPREIDADAADERLELVGPDLDLADDERAGVDARLGALAAAHDRLDPRDQLL